MSMCQVLPPLPVNEHLQGLLESMLQVTLVPGTTRTHTQRMTLASRNILMMMISAQRTHQRQRPTFLSATAIRNARAPRAPPPSARAVRHVISYNSVYEKIPTGFIAQFFSIDTWLGLHQSKMRTMPIGPEMSFFPPLFPFLPL
jgi:hypothetical protein